MCTAADLGVPGVARRKKADEAMAEAKHGEAEQHFEAALALDPAQVERRDDSTRLAVSPSKA